MKNKIVSFSVILISALLFIFIPEINKKFIFAGDEACGGSTPSCWPTRSIDIWTCATCKNWISRCSGNFSASWDCEQNGYNCTPYGGSCTRYCSDYFGTQDKYCTRMTNYAACNTSPGNCGVYTAIKHCISSYNTCTESEEWNTFGCCGPGGGATPTPAPPSCSCSSPWSPGECGVNGCAANQRSYTRTCNPAGCNQERDCVNDSNCGCNWSWTPGACNTAPCPSGTRIYYETGENPPGCNYPDYTCNNDPTCVTKSCQISLSPVTIPFVGATTNPDPIVNVLNEAGATVANVVFTSDNPAIASIVGITYGNPDNLPPFQTRLQANAIGSTVYRAVATMSDGVTTCEAGATVNVNVQAWSQFWGGSIISQGNITFSVPSTPTMQYLMTSKAGEQPGIPISAVSSGSITATPGSISTTNWKVTGSPYNGDLPSYTTLRNKIPASAPTVIGSNSIDQATLLTGGTEYPAGSGNYYFQYTGGGSFNIGDGSSEIDLSGSSRKIIIFADCASVNIQSKIKLNRGRGLLMVVTNGDINISPNVNGPQEALPLPDVEGIFFTDGSFSCGSFPGTDNDGQLHIRGSVVARGSIILQRDLFDDQTTPGEIFEYAPDLTILIPAELSKKTVSWKEVNP